MKTVIILILLVLVLAFFPPVAALFFSALTLAMNASLGLLHWMLANWILLILAIIVVWVGCKLF